MLKKQKPSRVKIKRVFLSIVLIKIRGCLAMTADSYLSVRGFNSLQLHFFVIANIVILVELA
jgi:hypothetical protein